MPAGPTGRVTGASSAPTQAPGVLPAHLPGMPFVFTVAPDGTSHFPYVAPACEEIYGFPATVGMADARRMHGAIHPDDQHSFRSAWRESQDRLVPLYWEGRILHTDGRVRDVTITSQPRRLPSGACEWHGLVVPRSGVLAPEPDELELLAERQRHQAELLDMLGHDIGTPLAAVMASAEHALAVLDDADPTGGPTAVETAVVRRSLDVVVANTRRLDALRRDLLALSTSEAGRLVAHPSPVRVAPHLHAAAELVRGRARVEVVCRPATTCLVQAGHLDQLLSNLVSNADKFARDRIVIAAHTVGDRVQVSVDDDGPGVAPELRAWLFTRYARGEQGPERPGHGLGLHIVRHLALANGATVQHQPSALGGARFVVELPSVVELPAAEGGQ